MTGANVELKAKRGFVFKGNWVPTGATFTADKAKAGQLVGLGVASVLREIPEEAPAPEKLEEAPVKEPETNVETPPAKKPRKSG
jgi:hypothetical protein